MEGPGTRARIEAGLVSATEHRIPRAYCLELENRSEMLRKSIGPITNEPRFNVNRFLEVFDRVCSKPGYVLDYYHDHLDSDLRPLASSFMGLDDDTEPRPRRHRYGDRNAEPFIFARPESQSHDETAEIARDLYWHRPHLMTHQEFERSPEGLLQWVIFRTAVSQFHLCWHANYYYLQFILSHSIEPRRRRSWWSIVAGFSSRDCRYCLPALVPQQTQLKSECTARLCLRLPYHHNGGYCLPTV